MSRDRVNIDALSAAEQRELLGQLLRKKSGSLKTYPLSFSQQRLWFLDQLGPGNAAYNITKAVFLAGALDVNALEKSLEELIRRHAILRTTFVTVNDRPVQVVSPSVGWDWSALDLRSRPDPLMHARRLASDEASRPFDLKTGPLFRAILMQLGEREHALIFSLHHIISDGWSMELLVREVADLYRAFSTGKPAALPELKIQYGDFADWQWRHFQGEVLEAELDYWKSHLAGAPATLELHTDNQRPLVTTYNGAVESLIMPASLAKSLTIISREQKATLFMTLLAGFSVLLYRYSNQKDFLIGSPISNRNKVEIERLLGLFANTLVFRMKLDGATSFRKLLATVRDETLEAFKHQDLPFERLVELLQPERNLSRSPLFQIMFDLGYPSAKKLDLAELELTPLDIDQATAKFDLYLFMKETDRGLEATLEYNSDLFGPATIRRMLGHLEILLKAIVVDPDKAVSELPILTESERHQLLIEWNRNATECSKQLSIHELFEEQVKQTSEAIALVSGDERLCYRELNARANRLGRYLRSQGVGVEDLVGVCLGRSTEMVVSLLGVLKAGAAYVPLDPAYPKQRLELIAEEAGMCAVLSEAKFEEVVSGLGARAIFVDEQRESISGMSGENLENESETKHLAYVIYTSGSTGKPKGVMISHGAVVNLLCAMSDKPGLNSDDRLLAVTTLSFDIAALELFLPLVRGARLVLASPDTASDPLRLMAQMEREAVTVMQATPATWRMLLDAEWSGRPGLKILCGGEALPADLAERLRRCGESLWNMYGPTETTIWSLASKVERTGSRGVTIGGPIANTKVYVLDQWKQSVPIGVVGELYLGGAGLARGYWRQPELTSDKFIPDSFGEEAGARLYRTGDLVRYLPNGELEFLGRMDHQVKVRGYRIELGEIEAVLRRHESVSESVVIAREDVPGEKRLVGYVVARDRATIDGKKLQGYLKEKLPEYMVPGAFVELEALPLLPNGKVNRGSLPLPERGVGEQEESYEAPATATEELLAGIWGSLLAVERIGKGDNFFDLGGHSLLATQLVSRVRRVFAIDLSLTSVFQKPTLKQLAAEIEALQKQEPGKQYEPLVAIDRNSELPLSFAQQRLWFIDQLDPGNPAYNIHSTIRLSGELNLESLEWSLKEIVRRHETLRTTFREREGRAEQLIGNCESFSLEQIDLSNQSLQDGEKEARHIAVESAQERFNLSLGPLFRVRLVKLQAQEHLLMVTMHHIISDGWSIAILLSEIRKLYTARCRGDASPLSELPIQYADYAMWQQEWLKGEVLNKQLQYWREQLKTTPAVLELPTDRLRPATQTYRGSHKQMWLSRNLTRQLKDLSRRENTTLFMTLLASFQILLSRYSGMEDIVVGTAIAGRNRVEVENLIGFFVNTLVMRTDLNGDPRFREALKRVRTVALSAYAHQDVPFEKLVEELQPERDMSHTPLFQVMFAFQNAAQSEMGLDELRLRWEAVQINTAKFDLTVAMEEANGRLSCAFNYNTDLFEAATIDRMMGHFQNLLEAVLSEPERRISELSLSSEAEVQQVLTDWNQTEREYPQRSIAELFEQQAERTPEATALIFGAEEVSYGELNKRANQLAHYLGQQGVQAEVVVGLVMERSLELVVGLLGILKAGGAYLPLDPEYPSERLAFMLEDAGVSLLLTQQHLEGAFTTPSGEQLSATVQVISVDSEWSEIGEQSAANPGLEVGPDNLAYVMYTSGSTGMPKGVSVPQRAVVRLVQENDFIKFGAEEVYLQLAPVTFDAATLELWGSLLNGARLVLMGPRAPSLAELGAALRQYGVTTLWLTAGLFHLMVEERLEDLVGVRQLLAGGDVLSATAVQKYLAAAAEGVLINGYGPTENTTFSCTQRLARGWEQKGKSVPIGRPIGNTQVYVLDERLEPVPVGVAGELYVGGAGLARDYLGRAELTAEKFVPHPYSEEGGERLYRTGDQVRWLGDGTLEFLGRLDQQVKIRGFRVEIGEVEAVLEQYWAIAKAVVVSSREGSGEKRLVAYVVAEAAVEPTAAEIFTYLREKLPGYMLPSLIVMIPELPLTANGKIDRGALPAPELGTGLGPEYVAPQTEIEEMLAGIWADVLRVERVGTADNFFDLGGHSLLATQVVSRMREAFQVELPVRHLFEAPTVRSLGGVLEEAVRAAKAHEAVPIARVGREEPLPLSFAQQRLWFLDQLNPGSATYNVPLALRLEGEIDVAAMQRTFTELFRRHEALRTVFVVEGNQPVQVIQPPAEVEVPVVDLSALDEAEREAEALRVIETESRRPMDLARGPLLRVKLVRVGDQKHVLLMTMHHIVSDGWSMGVLVREMTTLYEGFRRGEVAELPELSIQYADFACWQRDWLQGEVLEEQVSYWKKQLHGAPAMLELPTDRARPAVQSFRGATASLVLSESLSKSLKDLSRREGVTLFMTLLAAFKVLLYRYTGQETIVVGSPIAGRNRAETEGLIGFFVNTLPIRTDFSSDLSFTELLSRVREATLGAYAHQDLPFERIVTELQSERHTSHSPLFQVLMVLQNTPEQSLSLDELNVDEIPIAGNLGKFDLTLTIQKSAQGLRGSLSYKTDLFDSKTIERMVQHFRTLLEGIVSNPAELVSRLPLLTDDALNQLIVEWNDTGVEYSQHLPVPQLFERQVETTPETTALIHEDTSLTYRELNARANRLGHYLRRLGVGPDILVGVCAERSCEMVVGVLAVLKAGGAYVPLDYTYPKQRLAFMMQNARPLVLLTQERLLEHLPAHDAKIVCMDRDWQTVEHESCQNLEPQADASNLAYVIYTSGSTGEAKGVLIEHRQLLNYVFAVLDRLALPPEASYAWVQPLTVDSCVTAIYPPLIRGGTLHLLSQDCAASPQKMSEYFEQHKIDCLKIAPSHLAALQAAAEHPEQLLPQSCLVLGGEVSHWSYVRELQDMGTACRLFNHYGPTETTVGVSTYSIDRREREARGATVPIGRPLANTQLYILDSKLQPVPAGVRGELFVGGELIARGYLDRPDLTAERFVPDPLSPVPGARRYQTGDVVRHLADGNIEFLGRLDNQVKIRGFRIELGEIEAALKEHPSVRDVLALVYEEVSNKRLVAYVVSQDAEKPSPRDLRTFLKERLPEHMIPWSFTFLEALPLTPHGKIDRRALPEPDEGPREKRAGLIKARTAVEKKLAKIWEQVLGIEEVGIEDNFFELGGDSILSIQITARANQAGLHFTTKQIFENQTIAELAAVAGTEEAVVAEQGLASGEVPLTPTQERFFEQELVDAHHWNQAVMLAWKEVVDASALEQALGHLLRHHDALRLRFKRDEEGWKQHLGAASEQPELVEIDVTSLRGREQLAAIEEAANALQGSLNLEQGPLIRVGLIDVGPERGQRILIAIHHLAVDGVSWRILLEDLQTLYGQVSRGETIKLPAKTTSFKQWAELLQQQAQSEEAEAEAEYWERLGGESGSRISVDKRAGENTEGSAGNVSVRLGTEETELLLKEVPRIYNTQINDVLLTALALAMEKWTGAQSVLVDVEGHGREELEVRADVSRTVGWFTIVYPVLLKLGGSSVGENLKLIKEQLRTVPRRGIGYGLLRYLHRSEEMRKRMKSLPAAEISFNYLGQLDQVLETEGMLATAAGAPSGDSRSRKGRRNYLLNLIAAVSVGQLQVTWLYSENRHERETIQRLLYSYIEQLRTIIAHCQSLEAGGFTPSDFPLANLDQQQLDKITAIFDTLEQLNT